MSVKRSYDVFVINLKKDVIKKNHMASHLNKFAYKPIFVNAVYGKELSLDVLKKCYDEVIVKKKLGRALGLGEVGCYLSHVNIYKKIIDENIKYALILEDDIQLTKDLGPIIDEIINHKAPWELVLLGHHSSHSRSIQTSASYWGGHKLSGDYALNKPCALGCGTYGYLINLKGAKKILGYLDNIEKPIDHYTGDTKYTNLYVVNPPVINIDEFLTDNYNSMGDRSVHMKKSIKESTLSKVKKAIIFRELIYVKDFLKSFFYRILPVRIYKKSS